uniref:Serine/threonine-protein phosphatase PGAM5, mitochondrial n=1 Tax=Parascaris univalens TaxID=6257 RepID=A0A915CAM4_PARUN
RDAVASSASAIRVVRRNSALLVTFRCFRTKTDAMAILSRMAKLGIPLTVAAATAGALFYDDIRGRFSVKAEQPVVSPFVPLPPTSSAPPDTDIFPRKKWHSNWDSRDPLSLVDQEEYNAADPASRKEMLQKVKATATRHIFLIRHGQYFMETEEKNLTPLGREQAVLLGKRLAQSGQKFDVLITSSMRRASETADLVLNELAPLATRVDSILEEGAPYPPEPPITDWRPKQKVSVFSAIASSGCLLANSFHWLA